MGKLRLALIAGGKSSEREVSLKSGNQVYQALNQNKYDIRRYDPLTDLGSLVQGSGVLASALAMNKELSKIVYQQAGLRVPRTLIFDRQGAPSPGEIEAALGLPVVIKPVSEGSSIGVTKASTLKTLQTGLAAAFALDNRVLVEEFIPGTEVTGGVLGNARLQALPLVEIIPASTYAFFDYEAKYQPGASQEICPARLEADLTRRAQECALTAHKALGCRGYSRTDMMIKDGKIYVLETNTIPGMTATSLFPQGAKAAGLDFPDLLDTLINLALEKEQ
jgi:D-alanine-D-alanine ligase